MTRRKFQLDQNDFVLACPKCANNTQFVAYADYCAEDCCEIWIICICEYDPTSEKSGYRIEDVWGSLDAGNVRAALDCWNEAITNIGM